MLARPQVASTTGRLLLVDGLAGDRFVFTDRPMLVYWEATQACDLACRHCRAEAVSTLHPNELSTNEGRALLAQIAGFGAPLPHLVLTGGDPMRRPDLLELIAEGRKLGLSVSVTPAGTPGLTRERLRELRDAKVASIALSLDGASAASHDSLRRVAGSFDATVAAAHAACDLELPMQVNTLVTASMVRELAEMDELVRSLGPARWALFFLIRTGRGRDLEELSPAEAERFLNRLRKIALDAPYPIKTTEAPHYRRVVYTHLRARGWPAERIMATVGRGFGIRDGNGIIFVSHTGHVFPSGFFPLALGNVRSDDLVDLYRHHPTLRRLRDPDALAGKCGRCEFRALCGGSRARAFVATGDGLGADPLCAYEPPAPHRRIRAA